MTPDLLTRLAEAKEGSRELDAEIAEDVLGHIVEPEVMSASPTPLVRLLVIPMVKAGAFELPHYTTSIDCALTLVPEGAFWDMKSAWHRHGYRAGVWIKPHSDACAFHSDAKTPALALCHAALQAHIAAKVAA